MKSKLKWMGSVLLGLSVLTACSQMEVQYPEPAKQISLSPMVQTPTSMTKVPLVNGGSLNSADDFRISAYMTSLDENHLPRSSNFFTNITFSYQNSAWEGGQYWPMFHCRINFSAVSRRCDGNQNVDITWDNTTPASAATVVLKDNTYFSQSDLMFGGAQGRYDASGRQLTPLHLNHALCWVNFGFKSTTEEMIFIKEVVLKSSYDGVLNLSFDYDNMDSFDPQTYATATWTPAEMESMRMPKSDYKAFAGVMEVTKDEQIYGGGFLALPSTSEEREITIVYTMDITNADGAKEEKEFEYKQKVSNPWEMGKKYTYLYEFSPSELNLQSTCSDWTDGTNHSTSF